MGTISASGWSREKDDWKCAERAAARPGFVLVPSSYHAGLKSAITTRSAMGRFVSLVIIGLFIQLLLKFCRACGKMGGPSEK